MMARRGMLGMLAGGAVALLSACNPLRRSGYRFKMTVEVETPEGLKTGWSVYEVEANNVVALTPGGVGRERKLRGQAVVVDIASGKALFALVENDSLAEMSMAALDPAYKNDWVESAKRIAAGTSIQSPALIMTWNHPMLVTFTDIDDPSSVQRVDPANLAASFGPNIRLKRITVEVTDDDVTTGIEKRLRWRKSIGKNQLSGDRFEDFRKPELAAHLSAYSFSTEHPE